MANELKKGIATRENIPFNSAVLSDANNFIPLSNSFNIGIYSPGSNKPQQAVAIGAETDLGGRYLLLASSDTRREAGVLKTTLFNQSTVPASATADLAFTVPEGKIWKIKVSKIQTVAGTVSDFSLTVLIPGYANAQELDFISATGRKVTQWNSNLELGPGSKIYVTATHSVAPSSYNTQLPYMEL